MAKAGERFVVTHTPSDYVAELVAEFPYEPHQLNEEWIRQVARRRAPAE